MLIKLEWLGYRTVEKNYDNMLRNFHTGTSRTDRQTDGQTCRQTDRIAISISRVSDWVHFSVCLSVCLRRAWLCSNGGFLSRIYLLHMVRRESGSHLKQSVRKYSQRLFYVIKGNLPTPDAIFWALGCFLPRDAMHKRGRCRQAVSVRPSCSWILSKRIQYL